MIDPANESNSVGLTLHSGPSNETPYPPAQYYRPQHEDSHSQMNAGFSESSAAMSPVSSHQQGEGYLPINPKR